MNMGYWKFVKNFFAGWQSDDTKLFEYEEHPSVGVVNANETPTPQRTGVTADQLRSKYEAEAPAMREKLFREAIKELDGLLLAAFEGKKMFGSPTHIIEDLSGLKCFKKERPTFWFGGYEELVNNHLLPEYQKRGFKIKFDPDETYHPYIVIFWELPTKQPLTPPE